MKRVEMIKPDIDFNPISICDIKLSGKSTQIQMKIIKRYCDLDIKNGIINLYLELRNGNIQVIKMVKYWQWVAAGQCDYVLCDYHKFSDNEITHNFLELSSFPKPSLFIKENVIQPLSETNKDLLKGYCRTKYEKNLTTRVLSKSNDGLTLGFGVSTINNGRTYARAVCSLENLIKIGIPIISYRELLLEGKIYKTDLEAITQ